MFAALNKDHAARQASVRSRLERYRREAQTAVDLVNAPLVDSLNLGVAQVFKNERDLEVDAKRLQTAATVYQKQCRDWLNMVDELDNALKELGDVGNWSSVMERDMLQILTAMERVRNPKPVDPPKEAQPGPVSAEEEKAVEDWLNDE